MHHLHEPCYSYAAPLIPSLVWVCGICAQGSIDLAFCVMFLPLPPSLSNGVSSRLRATVNGTNIALSARKVDMCWKKFSRSLYRWSRKIKDMYIGNGTTPHPNKTPAPKWVSRRKLYFDWRRRPSIYFVQITYQHTDVNDNGLEKFTNKVSASLWWW